MVLGDGSSFGNVTWEAIAVESAASSPSTLAFKELDILSRHRSVA